MVASYQCGPAAAAAGSAVRASVGSRAVMRAPAGMGEGGGAAGRGGQRARACEKERPAEEQLALLAGAERALAVQAQERLSQSGRLKLERDEGRPGA
eukprot:3838936-Prymnesium_polylepis.1